MDRFYGPIPHYPPLRRRLRLHPRSLVLIGSLQEQANVHQWIRRTGLSMLHRLCGIHESHGPIRVHHFRTRLDILYLPLNPYLGPERDRLPSSKESGGYRFRQCHG